MDGGETGAGEAEEGGEGVKDQEYYRHLFEDRFPQVSASMYAKFLEEEASDGECRKEMMGKRQVVECLLEEEAHRRSGAMDKTRMFQTYLFQQWVEAVCRLRGEVL